MCILIRLGSFHRDEDADGLLSSDAMQYYRCLPWFRKNTVKTKAILYFETFVTSYKSDVTTRKTIHNLYLFITS